MTQIKIALENFEHEALQKLARFEKRDTRQQAALLIRQSLEKLGLLSPQTLTPPMEAAQDEQK